MTVDEQAFVRQLKAMMPRLIGAGAAYLGSRQDGEDLASDVLTRAWSRRDQWSGKDGSFEPWVWKIFHRCKADHYREQDKRPEVEFDTELAELLAIDLRTLNPEQSLIVRETVNRLLQRLPMHYRDVLIEVRVNDQSCAKVAELLDLPLGTVLSRLSRLKQLLGESREALSYD